MLERSIRSFSNEIYGKEFKREISDDDSSRKLHLKNISMNISTVLNKQKSIEFQVFENKKPPSFAENLTEETFDNLDIDNLRSILKTKSRNIKTLNEKIKILNKTFTNSLKEETDKNTVLETLIKLRKKEAQKNNDLRKDLRKEIGFWREKANLKKIDTISSNYFIATKNKTSKMQQGETNDNTISENLFLGDSDVSFSSNINNNIISKKWFSGEEKLLINFDDLGINLKKINYVETKADFISKKEFKFIELEIYNFAESILVFNDVQLDSTESHFNLFKLSLSLIRFNCRLGFKNKFIRNTSFKFFLVIQNLSQKISFSRKSS